MADFEKVKDEVEPEDTFLTKMPDMLISEAARGPVMRLSIR